MHPTSRQPAHAAPHHQNYDAMLCALHAVRPEEIHHGSFQVPSAASWTGQEPANRAHRSATGITCAVEAARMTRWRGALAHSASVRSRNRDNRRLPLHPIGNHTVVAEYRIARRGMTTAEASGGGKLLVCAHLPVSISVIR